MLARIDTRSIFTNVRDPGSRRGALGALRTDEARRSDRCIKRRYSCASGLYPSPEIERHQSRPVCRIAPPRATSGAAESDGRNHSREGEEGGHCMSTSNMRGAHHEQHDRQGQRRRQRGHRQGAPLLFAVGESRVAKAGADREHAPMLDVLHVGGLAQALHDGIIMDDE